jgi:hypothetical protein
MHNCCWMCLNAALIVTLHPLLCCFTACLLQPAFDAWRTGEAFKEAHGGGGIGDFMKVS